MRNVLRLLTLVVLLTACSVGTASSNSTEQTPIRMSQGSFTLTILTPADLAVVSEPQVELRGEVSEPAVLTVDENSYLLEAGTFNEPVQLQEGINAIQIVASDMDGNEVDLILTITYQP